MEFFMEMPNRADLESIIENIFRNYIFGFTLLKIGHESDISQLETTTLEAHGPQSFASVSLNDLFSGATKLTDRPILVSEFGGMLRRSFLAEVYESIKWYCNETKQFESFKNQTWYGFLYVLRNSVSHRRGGWLGWDQKFADAKTGEIRWRHVAFRKEDTGKEFQIHDSDIMLLYRDIRIFVSTLS